MKNLKIIAEIGSNWSGSKKIGKKMIKAAKMAEADFIKFQMWRAEDLYSKSEPYWNLTKKSEITCKVAKQFKEYADKIGIGCFWSVFYPEAVDCLEDLNVKYYKIASWTAAIGHIHALETMQRVAKTGKPVIISMGMGGDIEVIKKIFKNNKKYFLYCISKYPTSVKEVDFSVISKYDGFSDHTMGHLAPLVYAMKVKDSDSVKFLEKHVSIKESKGQDKPNSIDMNEFSEMVKEIKTVTSLKI